MIKCHRMSLEGHNVGRTVGDSLLSLSRTVPYLCSDFRKYSFKSPNIETKTCGSAFLMRKYDLLSKLLYFMEGEDKM